ncbi:NB-ARC domain-containing protein [Streptomyces sp. NPDC001351]|uniref:NB-ARC domain-containing protein n=1 Tax=Streptomyces sp. NPDC001351 TaxID=3364564 RepID=UPI003681838E
MLPPLPDEAFDLPAATSPVVSLPERARLFVGREDELAMLDAAFRQTGGVVVHAVHGLGGIGKSTLTARWASAQAGVCNPVWWISAETGDDLDAGLADLALALQPALADLLSRKVLRDLAVRWLSDNEGWLLVLDNVSDPADVKPILARATGGRFLITTRQAAGWQRIAETLSLNVLELPEAVTLFEQVYGQSTSSTEELCRELGCLPLAVEQAGAYCREASLTPQDYLELRTANPEYLLSYVPEGGRTIARVWQVTLDRLVDAPFTVEILRVIAWWAPDGIPRSYLEPLGGPTEVTEALRLLAAHSMITLHDDTISVHRLVQAVSRTGDPDNPHRTTEAVAAARETAADLLNRAAENFESSVHSGWFAHAEALCGHIGTEPKTPESALLLVHVANWHMGIDDEEAVARSWQAVRAAEAACGRRHEITLHARMLLVQALLAVGVEGEATRLLREDWSTTARVYGRRNPQTFEIRAHLAYELRRCSDVTAAVSLARKNARRADRVLGSGHPAALEAGVTLAAMLTELAASDFTRYGPDAVAELMRRHDQIAERAEGPLSEKFVALMLGLIRLRAEMGEPEDALKVVEVGIEAATEAHGPLSLTSLFYRTVQVKMLHEFGETDRARILADLLLTDWERGFAETHAVGLMRKTLAHVLPPGVEPRA